MIQHMYSPNNIHRFHQQPGGSQEASESNPFAFDLEHLPQQLHQGLLPMGFTSYLPSGKPPSSSSLTSPVSVSHVPICKGTSKHFFKLENKVALLKEVIALNPFEDTSRWKIVSDNYNIWTNANQPDRFYAAVDYLPRKVREMLTNFKVSLKKDEDTETEAKPASNPPLSSTLESYEEAENLELRGLLYEVYQMMNNVGKQEKHQKRNSIKRLKIETSTGHSMHSPEKIEEAGSKRRLSHVGLDEPQQFRRAPEPPYAAENPGHFAVDYTMANAQMQMFNKLLEPMMGRLNMLENKLLIIENINRNNLGLPANVVPFTESLKPGIPPFQDLSLLYTALDVENLSQDQLETYLKYYNIATDPVTRVSGQKKKLACFLGILNPDNYSDYLRT